MTYLTYNCHRKSDSSSTYHACVHSCFEDEVVEIRADEEVESGGELKDVKWMVDWNIPEHTSLQILSILNIKSSIVDDVSIGVLSYIVLSFLVNTF